MSKEEAFTSFPILTTNRLHLRHIQFTDAEALFVIKSDLEVTKQYGQEPHRAITDTQRWIERLQTSYEHHEDFAWCIAFKGQDALIGVCTLWNFDAGFHCAEIGYELHPMFRRKGIMTEAVSAVLTFGFNELGLHRIEANPLAGNLSSKNLLLKLGFTYEGNLRQRHFFHGHFEDQLYFGLLRDEWNQRLNG